ncbi:Crp/Fnr family transcriptional regulator [bacterium]|nr:Crp/Fnr family transcriptional regulator [bacterium]
MPTRDPPPANRLLAGLPDKAFRRLRAVLVPVRLDMAEVLYRPGEAIRYVYFPTGGVISVVVTMADGASAEAGMVGNEGVLGLWVVLGAGTSPFEAVVQEPAAALRVPAEAFAAEVARNGALRDLLRRYTDAFLMMVSQSAACNRLHAAEQRLCRWLLMTHDRAGADGFLMTQEFLGRMLGVRRMSITAPARKLQAAGLIRYTRGRMTVLDRAGLERAACECYGVVRARLDGLLPPA